MFSLNNTDNEKPLSYLAELRRALQNGHKEASAFFSMKAPFQLQFFTMHPEDKDNYYFHTLISPEFSTYIKCSQKEHNAFSMKQQMHQHDFYELFFVLDGYLYQNIENTRHLYIKGSCCLLNCNVRHVEEFSTEFRVVFLQMSYEFCRALFTEIPHYFKVEHEHIGSIFENFMKYDSLKEGHNEKGYLDFIPLKDNDWIIGHVHNMFEQITKELLSPSVGSSMIIMSFILRLFNLLDNHENYTTTPVKLGSDLESRLFQSITALLSQSNGRLSRSELVKQLNYSGDYLNKIVKKFTGLNIFDYGMTFCIKEVAHLLKTTDLSIAEITTTLKFTNRGHFNHLFANIYNMTPKEYRKNLNK